MDKKSFMRKVSCALTDKWKFNHEQGSTEEHNMQCPLLLLQPSKKHEPKE